MDRPAKARISPSERVRTVEWRTPVGTPQAAEPAPQTAQILLCGNQPLYRAALRSLIETHDGLHVSVECRCDTGEMKKALQADVTLAVIDVDLVSSSRDDLAHLESLLQTLAPHPTLILSSSLEPEPCQLALRHGVAGIVLKSNEGEVLLEAIESARRGKVWLDRAVLAEMFADSSHIGKASCAEKDKISQLTPREREIIHVACTGVTNKQIAEKLNISEATVRHHLGSVFGKLGVSTRSELVVYSYRHNLCDTKA
jgi:DNA-binding NarL/FixJ family response regulator